MQAFGTWTVKASFLRFLYVLIVISHSRPNGNTLIDIDVRILHENMRL